MGELLANYTRVVAAVRRCLAPAIRKRADEKMQVRLAVSLHTPDDELRDTLVPVNERWSVDEVLSAARYYADTSGRRVSIEYALIRASTTSRGGPSCWPSGCASTWVSWCTSM